MARTHFWLKQNGSLGSSFKATWWCRQSALPPWGKMQAAGPFFSHYYAIANTALLLKYFRQYYSKQKNRVHKRIIAVNTASGSNYVLFSIFDFLTAIHTYQQRMFSGEASSPRCPSLVRSRVYLQFVLHCEVSSFDSSTVERLASMQGNPGSIPLGCKNIFVANRA